MTTTQRRLWIRIMLLAVLVTAAALGPPEVGASDPCMNCVAKASGSMCSPGPNFGYTECEVRPGGVGCTPGDGGEPCNFPV